MTMEQRRKEWCDNLDDLMKCPVCSGKLSGHVYLCESGHNVCGECTQKVFPCKLCKKPYTSIRNHLAEVLSPQADTIKAFIMGTGAFAPKKIHKVNRKCMVTEKDFLEPLAKESTVNEDKNEDKKEEKEEEKKEEKSNVNSAETWGQFSCWIDRACDIKGTFSDIVEHFKKSHPLEFEEHLTAMLPYTQTWQMDYLGVNSFVNRAFKIPNGLFILHIRINEDGEMRACVLMYANSRTAFRHSYKIEIECDTEKVPYIGQVDCSRVHKNFLFIGKKGICIDRNNSVYNTLVQKKRFMCSVMIDRKSEASTDEAMSTTSSNADSKQKPNRFNKQGNNDKKFDNGARSNDDPRGQKKIHNRQNFKGPQKNFREKNNHSNQSMTNKLSGSNLQLNKNTDDHPRQPLNAHQLPPNMTNQPTMSHVPPLMGQMHPGRQQYPLYPNLHPDLIAHQQYMQHQRPPMMHNQPNVNMHPYPPFTHSDMHKPEGPSGWMNPHVKDELLYQRNSSPATAAPTAPPLDEKQAKIEYEKSHSEQFRNAPIHPAAEIGTSTGPGNSTGARPKKKNSKDNSNQQKDCVVS